MLGIVRNRKSIIWRIEGIDPAPLPLTMLINPANLDVSYTPIVNETRTLGGFVQEFWGEQLTTVSASGQTAMFYDNYGITNKNARDSESYNNFIGLVNIYRSNGKEYYKDKSTLALKANPDRIASFGTVIMTYVDKEYQGYFESFNFRETNLKPFSFEYDFSFKVVRTIGDFIIQGSNFLAGTTNG
jgi:hypothetical protein